MQKGVLRHLELTDRSDFKGNIAVLLEIANFLFFHVGTFRKITNYNSLF